jgi:hypothetical protein
MKTLISTILILTLASCSSLRDVNDTSRDIIDYLSDKTHDLADSTLDKVESTISDTVPNIVNSVLNSEGIAFLVVVSTVLLSFVVLTSIYLLVGSARAGWKRWVAK